jgi:glycosyltransferase involved in cell wall biosynthesis
LLDEETRLTPKIEVVVPAYSVEPYIAEALDSVLAQNQ